MIEEEDYNTLRDSIDSFDNFNNIALAQLLEKHALLEFRRLAAHLYKKNTKWDDSITLSKQDKLFKDAIVTASASNSIEVAEDLLTYFVDIGNKECFAAVLYVCFDLLRSDVVEELSWRHGLNDFYMPYKIQNQRSLVNKVSGHWCTFQGYMKEPDVLFSDRPAREGGQGEVEEGGSKRATRG